MALSPAWIELTSILEEVETLQSAGAVLAWDQQTMMPRRAAGARGSQLALISRLAHERLTDDRVGRALERLATERLNVEQAATVRVVRRAYDRSTKLSPGLVVRLAEAESAAFEAWVTAKQTANFPLFAPYLSQLLDLTREKIQAIDAHSHPYDVLLDDYDPGTNVQSLTSMFGRLQKELGILLDAVKHVEPLPAFDLTFDVARQRGLHQDVIRALNYDLEAGRLDDAEHPFSIGIHPTDVRITAHLYANDLLNSLGGTIHETGHALYEQGLPVSLKGTYVSRAASYGLHESQSRFWENTIGRSLPFLKWLTPGVRKHFPEMAVDAQAMYRGANRIVPGLVRIKADEVTYNLHIIVRFEIELALMEERLKVADLPEAWNEKYRDYLGITPSHDGEGVLQDVHWSGGSFGYFPSYTLGNLYAAGIAATLDAQMPSLWTDVEHGSFGGILAWLRENVHQKANLQEAPDIMRSAIGSRDLVQDLMNHLWNRHGALHGVSR